MPVYIPADYNNSKKCEWAVSLVLEGFIRLMSTAFSHFPQQLLIPIFIGQSNYRLCLRIEYDFYEVGGGDVVRKSILTLIITRCFHIIFKIMDRKEKLFVYLPI